MEPGTCPTCGSPRLPGNAGCATCGRTDAVPAGPSAVASDPSVPEGPGPALPDGYDDLLDLIPAPPVGAFAAAPPVAAPAPTAASFPAAAPAPTLAPDGPAGRRRRTAGRVAIGTVVVALVVAAGLGAGVLAGNLANSTSGDASSGAAAAPGAGGAAAAATDALVSVTPPAALPTTAAASPVATVPAEAPATPAVSVSAAPTQAPAASVSPEASASIPDGTWTRLPSMPDPRWGAGTAVLADGRVLVVGGATGKTSWSASAAVDIYDPATRAWSRGAPLPEARSQPTVIALPADGSILVLGGARDQVPLATAFRYRPAADAQGPGSWEWAGTMTIGRVLATATILPSGMVLVAGGGAGGPARNAPAAAFAATGAADLFDPEAGRWTATGSMGSPRAMHTATRLPDGRVLVAGGASKWSSVKSGSVYASAEAYDEASGTWSPVAALAAPRYGHAAAALTGGAYPDGSVLVAGGWSRDRSAPQATGEVYDAAGDRWTAVEGRLSVARALLPLVEAGGGSLLAIGGAVDARTITDACDVFDPATGRWAPAAAVSPGVLLPAVSSLESGEVLVAAGATGVSTAGVTKTTSRAQAYSSGEP